MSRRKVICILLLLVIILFDMVLFWLDRNEYYFIFLKSTGYIFPIILNIIVFFVIGKTLKLSNDINGIVLILGIIILGGYSFFFSITNLEYSTSTSPEESEILYIGHRTATLGETRYIYVFYQEKYGVFMKKIVGKDLVLINSGLPTDSPTWVNEHKVKFSYADGDSSKEHLLILE
ncbi:hypothetical protein [Bacillus cereus group sp. BfR-BA-01380]|uniref:hypothetical protein n=1 Tax=Bacillus cereus group sp. BfR-BA-01380 TaxID=2920324 RepID=UPI001F561D08|nr:hypothetical protein [Bacillus cereus group sp. BfR-BA-01380]